MSGLGIICQCCKCGDARVYYEENGLLPGQSGAEDFTGNLIVRPQPNNLWLAASFPGPPDLQYGQIDGQGRAHPINPPFDSNASHGTWYSRRTVMTAGRCAFHAAKVDVHELPVFHPRYGTQYGSDVHLYVHFATRIRLDDEVPPSPFPPLKPPFNNLTVNGFKVAIGPYASDDHSTTYGISVKRCWQNGFDGGIPFAADGFWGTELVEFVEGAEAMFILDKHPSQAGMYRLRVWYNDILISTHYMAEFPEDFPEFEEVVHEMKITPSQFGFQGFHNPNTMSIDNYRVWIGKT